MEKKITVIGTEGFESTKHMIEHINDVLVIGSDEPTKLSNIGHTVYSNPYQDLQLQYAPTLKDGKTLRRERRKQQRSKKK